MPDLFDPPAKAADPPSIQSAAAPFLRWLREAVQAKRERHD